ncbi:hypothetical protein Pcinc_000443 [Petrolisthes cinctipes]|uniref:Peptidase M12A domain-containing protein n=1 Tax=Petrolisthes cinctipes TaxID=88211 RepID=A0AAE1GM36_PETCI|nr:hypothetical protein Pcinc_000443 [Petrolisthes cinctipes]
MRRQHPDFLDTNPDEVKGERLFEGDILLTPTQRRSLNERKGIAHPYYRWRDGSDGLPLVPYTFGDRSVDRVAVREGLEHWMEHTCITFQRATTTRTPHLRFIKGGGCYSYVGRMGQWRGQPVSIGTNCNVWEHLLHGSLKSVAVRLHFLCQALGFDLFSGDLLIMLNIEPWESSPTTINTDWLPTAKSQSPEVELGIVVHEVGHAIGFVHEQSRPDRDGYIKIINSNVIPNRLSNFNKYSNAAINNMDVPYDYSSVMHYGPKGFTVNGKTTISTHNPLAQGMIGRRVRNLHGLSHRDKLLANKMYNCIGKYGNYGFLNF